MVGDGPTTVMGHGGETPARPCTARRPYRALLASNAGAVVRWDHYRAAAVANEQRGASWVPAMATAVGSHCAELLRLLRKGEGEARRENESTGGS